MKYIDYTIQNRKAYIILNRPEKRNALSHELVAELKEAFKLAEGDDQVKVIILKANGEAFCAGADLAYLKQLRSYSHDENLADSNHLKELFLLIYCLKKIVISQVEGHALAGGCGLATVCDFVFAVPTAKFGYTEVKIGFIPALVMVFLLRKIGEGKAKQLLLTGDLIPADEAMQLGLVNKVVSSDEIVNYVETFAQRLVDTNSQHAMMLTKSMITQVQSMSLTEALSLASEMNANSRESIDCKKGIDAFLSKNKIIW